MNPLRLQPLTLICIVLLLVRSGLEAAAAANWPQFRGPQASGVDNTSEPPLSWNVESGENIRWQTPIPGLAHASPIVWGDHIFLATAVKPGAKPELKIGLYGDGASYTEKEPHQWRLL